MKNIILINTIEPEAISKTTRDAMKAKGVKIYEATELNIHHCVGCNHCWLKTPGVCSIHDDYVPILQDLAHADQMWVISGTSFGFLASEGKKVFDRVLPILTMSLHFKDGIMRHIRRYEQTTDVGLIYRGNGNQAYMEQWLGRMTHNIDGNPLGVFTIDKIEEAISCM